MKKPFALANSRELNASYQDFSIFFALVWSTKLDLIFLNPDLDGLHKKKKGFETSDLSCIMRESALLPAVRVKNGPNHPSIIGGSQRVTSLLLHDCTDLGSVYILGKIFAGLIGYKKLHNFLTLCSKN